MRNTRSRPTRPRSTGESSRSAPTPETSSSPRTQTSSLPSSTRTGRAERRTPLSTPRVWKRLIFWWMTTVVPTYKEWVGTTEMPQRPTRLEIHRVKYAAANGRLELLSLSELSDFEKGLISKDFFSALYRERRIVDPYGVYSEVLASWGVMCPHPTEQVSLDTCRACGGRIFCPNVLPSVRAVGGS